MKTRSETKCEEYGGRAVQSRETELERNANGQDNSNAVTEAQFMVKGTSTVEHN